MLLKNREKLRWCLKGEQTPGVPDDLWFSCCGVRQEGPQQSQLVQERRTFSAGREVKEMILRRQGLVSVRKKSSVHAGFALQCPRQGVWCAARCWRGACSLVRAAGERRCPGCDCRLPAHGGGCQRKARFAGAENAPWDRQWGSGTFFIPFTK